MLRILSLLLVAIIHCIPSVWAQITDDLKYREAGLPFIQNLDEEERSSHHLAMGSQGFMYVVRGKDVFEENGVSSLRTGLDSQGSIDALSVDREEGLGYIGGLGDFGYLELATDRNSEGYLKFTSLINYVPKAYRDFSAIWSIIIGEDAIYFDVNGAGVRENRYVFRLDKKSEYTPDQIGAEDSIFVWKIENNFTLWGGDYGVFLQERYFGLKQIIGDSIVMAKGGEQFNKNRLRLFIPLNEPANDSELKILTNTAPGELAIYENGTLTPFYVEPKLLAYLQENRIDNAIKLSNGHIAIATEYDGGVIIDQEGRWVQALNEEIGLKSKEIYEMCEDDQQGLWLATDKGTVRVEPLSPMTHYLETHGYVGEVEAFVKHKGVPYLVANNDLFYLSFSDDPTQLSSMEVIRENIDGNHFLSVGDDLLLGGRLGIHQIINQEAKLLPLDIEGIRSLHLSPFDSTLIYVSTYTSDVYILKKWENQWYDIGQFEVNERGTNYIVEEHPGKLWIGTSIDGIFQVEISQNSLKKLHEWTLGDEVLADIPVKIRQFTYEDGLSKGLAFPKLIGGQVVFRNALRIKSFNDSTQMMEPATSFGIDQYASDDYVHNIQEDNQGNIYLYSIKAPSALALKRIATSTLDTDGNWEIKETQLNRVLFSFKDSHPAIYPDPDHPEVIWTYGKDGVIHYDTSLETEVYGPKKFETHISFWAWTIQDSVFTHRSRGHQFLDLYQDHSSPVILDYENKYFDFTYFSNAFDGMGETVYQVFLEGYDEKGSKWTTETNKVYYRLPEGDYTFRVKARNVYNQVSEEGVLAFTVKPPWYRSWWAYTIYWILFTIFVGAISYFYNKWQSQQLEERNIQLEDTVEARTEEIRVKNIQLEETLDTLQKTQQQLILQEKLASLGQMTAGIAHEIKNPLNFVNNFAESSVEIADEFKGGIEKLKTSLSAADYEEFLALLDDLRENAVSIHKNGLRADGIVQSMMAHANDNRGELVVFDVNKLIFDHVKLAYEGYTFSLPDFRISIHQTLQEDLPKLSINPQNLGRVIINLMNNACYALEQKRKTLGENFIPEIQVNTKKLNNQVEIRIRDNGAGIPRDIRENIFTPFFTTKPTGTGNTGLGLSLSYDIITQGHLGTLTCESEEGVFTEFVIKLPI